MRGCGIRLRGADWQAENMAVPFTIYEDSLLRIPQGDLCRLIYAIYNDIERRKVNPLKYVALKCVCHEDIIKRAVASPLWRIRWFTERRRSGGTAGNRREDLPLILLFRNSSPLERYLEALERVTRSRWAWSQSTLQTTAVSHSSPPISPLAPRVPPSRPVPLIVNPLYVVIRGAVFPTMGIRSECRKKIKKKKNKKKRKKKQTKK